jgi:hypothetical protein
VLQAAGIARRFAFGRNGCAAGDALFQFVAAMHSFLLMPYAMCPSMKRGTWVVGRVGFSSGWLSLLAVAVACALGAPGAQALDLVPGGYGAVLASDDQRALADAGTLDLATRDGVAGLSLGFTPRHGAGLLDGSGSQDGPHFDLTVRGGNAAFDQLGLGTQAPTLYPGRRTDRANLTVGGAMRWADWSLGGGIGRADFLGTDVDLLSASLGYRGLNAQIAFGQSVDYQTTPSDVLMFSTDLAAWSWLTLESDLALGSAPSAEREEDSLAVGRLGIRLNF